MKLTVQYLLAGIGHKVSTAELKEFVSDSSIVKTDAVRAKIKALLGQNMIERIKETRGIDFSYTLNEEEILRYLEFSSEEILEWIQEMATFIYELQTPEEREARYLFKPHKKIPVGLLK